ncbi:sodium:solute symporter family transporter [Candidatus Lariskella endosymbiont of Epinotia ramella]|uniref:sodium:solute symporter family protein n=1 Tax=Candidatus Lariskella endosymbiont of Epinotia ramella TaxID=3066224 RepID=UPI0030D21E2B
MLSLIKSRILINLYGYARGLMQQLYGSVGRNITNITSIVISIGAVAMQAIAMGSIIDYFFQTGYSYSVIVSMLILSTYSAFGGVRSVAFTDVFQLMIFMVAIPIACSFVYHDIGGYKGIINSLPKDMINFSLNKSNIWLFLSLAFYSLLPVSSGVYMQRYLMCRNSMQLTYSLNYVAIISLFFMSIICIIGLTLKIKEPNIDSHIVFIYFIANHVAVGFKGLIVAGLLAVIMSTADSWLNNASVLFTHDIIRKIMHLTERQALLLARIFTFIIGILAIFIAIHRKELIEIEWFISNAWVPLIVIPLIAGFLKFRTNGKSFIFSLILAIFFTIISAYILGDFNTTSSMFGTIGSAIGLFGMHYWQKYNSAKLSYYQKLNHILIFRDK